MCCRVMGNSVKQTGGGKAGTVTEDRIPQVQPQKEVVHSKSQRSGPDQRRENEIRGKYVCPCGCGKV